MSDFDLVAAALSALGGGRVIANDATGMTVEWTAEQPTGVTAGVTVTFPADVPIIDVIRALASIDYAISAKLGPNGELIAVRAGAANAKPTTQARS